MPNLGPPYPKLYQPHEGKLGFDCTQLVHMQIFQFLPWFMSMVQKEFSVALLTLPVALLSAQITIGKRKVSAYPSSLLNRDLHFKMRLGMLSCSIAIS